MRASVRISCTGGACFAIFFCCVDETKVATIHLHLKMNAAEANKIFVVSDDKLRVRSPLAHKLKESVVAGSGPHAKASDYVVSVDGIGGSPEALLAACASGTTVSIKLQRDKSAVVLKRDRLHRRVDVCARA